MKADVRPVRAFARAGDYAERLPVGQLRQQGRGAFNVTSRPFARRSSAERAQTRGFGAERDMTNMKRYVSPTIAAIAMSIAVTACHTAHHAVNKAGRVTAHGLHKTGNVVHRAGDTVERHTP